VSLATPEKIRTLQRALYAKAKQEPTRRFHFLYDKVWREDILADAYASCRANGGAPGVDGETFARIEEYGVVRWLTAVREEIRTERYKPRPVKRVMIPKPGGTGQRPLGIGFTLNETRTRVCNARCEPLMFLGYTFGPMHSPRTGGCYNGAQPSKQAVAAIKERIRNRLRPGLQAMGGSRARPEPYRTRMGQLLQLWLGREGAARGTSVSVPRGSPLSPPTAQGRRVWFLAVPTGARVWRTGRGSGGSASSSCVCACLYVKSVREPDDRNGHVRFDERGEETERWTTRRERPRKTPLALGAAGPVRHRASLDSTTKPLFTQAKTHRRTWPRTLDLAVSPALTG
jgi:hypothetical protein